MVGSGMGYDYSNMNFCLLGLLIEASTGKTYERVVQESLLDPLGIGGMRFTSTYEIGPDEVSHFPEPGAELHGSARRSGRVERHPNRHRAHHQLGRPRHPRVEVVDRSIHERYARPRSGLRAGGHQLRRPGVGPHRHHAEHPFHGARAS